MGRTILLLSLTLAWTAHASPAGADGAAWDDTHMRSNFARQRGPAPPRPPIQGADRFHHANEEPTPAPPIGVAETTLRINPHAWSPGGPRAGGGGTPAWATPTRSGGALGNAAPTASAGVRGSNGSIPRTSTLATSSRRTTRR